MFVLAGNICMSLLFFFLILLFVFLIYVQNFVSKNLKSLIFTSALSFLSLRSARVISHKEKVNSWLSLGRSVVLFLAWTK